MLNVHNEMTVPPWIFRSHGPMYGATTSSIMKAMLASSKPYPSCALFAGYARPVGVQSHGFASARQPAVNTMLEYEARLTVGPRSNKRSLDL